MMFKQFLQTYSNFKGLPAPSPFCKYYSQHDTNSAATTVNNSVHASTTSVAAAAATAATSISQSCAPHPPPKTSPIFFSAMKAGFPGAAAAAAQSMSFMWVSTASAYQYRSGTKMMETFKILYAQGGLLRFYSGLLPTVLHVTLCRFGDTTANILTLQHTPPQLTTNIFVKTFFASILAASWRCTLLPLETIRSNLQVKGTISGLSTLRERIQLVGLYRALYSGATASFTAGLLGHFPFFCTVNYLSVVVKPLKENASIYERIGRNGGMGFLAAMCSDVVTNGFKIVATNKQTSRVPVSYYETARRIIKADGALALLTRGLKTRILGNGLQGAMFVLLWKEIENRRSASHTIAS